MLTFKEVCDLPCRTTISNGGHHLCLEAQTTDVMAKCLVPMPSLFKVLGSKFSTQAHCPYKLFCYFTHSLLAGKFWDNTGTA
jgi:hypothetical protein